MAAKPGLELPVHGLGGAGAKNIDHGLKPGGGGHGRAYSVPVRLCIFTSLA
jgi:hypothetical protein